MGRINSNRSTISLLERYLGTPYDNIQELITNLPAMLELLEYFRTHTVVGAIDNRMTFTQVVASTEWVIQHNMGKYPSVETVDGSKEEITGEVIHTDDMNLTIRFNQPVSGFAYIN
jgi:hypothetical protein